MNKRIYYIFVFVCFVLFAVSCSTTSRLGEGEVLYTGVKKLRINVPDTVDVPDGVTSNIKATINVKPNNSLYSPYIRHPFPLGLWLYNHWSEDEKGIKGWIYRKFVEQPVLMSDVRPDLRMKMVEDMLAKNGFFGATTSYELLYDKRNPKKARVNYTVNMPVPKCIAEIRLLNDSTEISDLINKIVKKDSYLKIGALFCTDSLSDVRNKVADRLRNRGYYFFRPEYLTFKADSTIYPGDIALQMEYGKMVPDKALRKYVVGNVTTLVLRNDGKGYADTLKTKKGTVIQMKPSKLREDLIPSCITLRKGQEMKVRALSNTQSYLSRLGIFNSISLTVTPLDSVRTDSLDVDIVCRFDTPLETQFEVNLTSKSNSYLGPGLSYGITNRNIFGGAERLSLNLNGSYEWQIGKIDNGEKRSKFSSYEIGLDMELAFPRLLAPKFMKAIKREMSWTRITLGGDIMNRPHFFRMVQVNAGINYDWMSSRFSKNQVTLFELKYNKLLRTTAEFEATMAENYAIAQSFQDQFIPKLSYTYTYDRGFRHDRKHITFQASIIDGGNIFSGLWGLVGVDGQKNLFGTPFSQFVKGTVQLIYSHKIRGDHKIVGRVYTGAAHAYGNSSEVPYTEQFYIGGANSLRAFAVRSIGPGSYHSEREMSNGYYDQTGTFRFEMNLEYRFPIAGMLKGAVFMDAGNIWLLKDDPMRPGGKLNASTFFKDLALGTGIGLRFDIGMIVVRGDLGIGLHLPYATDKKGYYNLNFKDSLAFNLAIGYPF